VEKIALTARYPYAGCTRIARELEVNYHYRNISMSWVLMEQFSNYLNHRGFDVSSATIANNKELYRRQLHVFAMENEKEFIDTLQCMIELFRGPIVIEKVRSDRQAEVLHSLGFKIIRIERPEHDVLATSRKHGHTTETWNALLQSGSEGRVSQANIDDTLTNTFTCDTITKYLVSTDTVGANRD
jgi:hypothetical protein